MPALPSECRQLVCSANAGLLSVMRGHAGLWYTQQRIVFFVCFHAAESWQPSDSTVQLPESVGSADAACLATISQTSALLTTAFTFQVLCQQAPPSCKPAACV